MALCPHCHTENRDNAATCVSCGQRLGSGGTLVLTANSPIPRPQVYFRVVQADGGAEAVLAMHSDIFVCGQMGDLELPDDPFVAGFQARFLFSGARLAVEDVGGGNGVFIRLRHEREVTLGGELRLGRQRLVVEPVAALHPDSSGTLAWGSPDPGCSLRLVQLLEGGARGSAFPLKAGDNTLGREMGDVTFPSDGFISGRHAVLTLRGERLWVKDVGSSNGTFLRLHSPAYVENGDQFLIGRQLIRVELQFEADPRGL